MVYLDNAATTFPKPTQVINEVVKCLKEYCGNPGRSSHKIAVLASEKIYDTREKISNFVSFNKPENIVFCHNATYGLNMIIKGLINHKCHIIISDLEHNSVIRPLFAVIKKYGGEISIYDTSLPPESSIIPLIKPNTELIITTLASNVTGQTIDYKAISRIAKKYNLQLVLDGSQFIGHRIFDASAINFDYLIVPGHKALFGIQGSGFVLINNEKELSTLIEGGSGYDTLNTNMPNTLPERYEAGTLSTPAIVSLSAGINYINSVGIDEIEEKISKLTIKCYDSIESLNNTIIYGADNGIVSFNFKGVSSSKISQLLSEDNIATRSGLHCAPFVHKKLGTVNSGAVRISFSHLNSISDIDKLYQSLKKISITLK